MLIILRGGTNSFKTTFANRFFDIYSIISADDVRELLFGSYYHFKEEALVSKYSNMVVESRLNHGLDTIVDSLNLHVNHMKSFIDIANSFGEDYIILSFKRDVKSAIEGSLVRGGPMTIASSVRQQYLNYDKFLYDIVDSYGDHFYEFIVKDEDSLDDIYLEYKQIKKIRNKNEAVSRLNK